jgi:hypothetical protein
MDIIILFGIDYLQIHQFLHMIDYKKIKDNFKVLGEELLAKVLHPDRLFKLMKIYDNNEVYIIPIFNI